MAAPSSLSGRSATVKVDGVDLHTYGMVVTNVNVSPPSVRRSTQVIYGRDGDLDYTKNYEPRSMRLSGHIIGNNTTDLLSYIDSLRTFFRLRQNGTPFTIIFQNQTDRYWTVKYDGSFNTENIAAWYDGRICRFTLALKCVYPYAEALTATVATIRHTIFRNYKITYAGTHPTPLHVVSKSPMDANLLDDAAGGEASEDSTLWTYTNCTGADNTDDDIYGTKAIRITRTSASVYYAQISVFSKISTTKNYVLGCFLTNSSTGNKQNTSVRLSLSTGAYYQAFATGDGFAFLKVSAAQLTGATTAVFRVQNDGTDSFISIDGCFLYEITGAEFLDSSYFPPPYLSDASGDDKRETVNPKLRLISGLNLMPYGHGDSVTDWSGITTKAVANDPLDQQQRAVMCWAVTDGVVYSPKLLIQPGKIYQLRYAYYVQRVGASTAATFIDFYGTDESDAFDRGAAVSGSSIAITAATSDWTWVTAEITTKQALCKFILRVSMNAGAIIFIKYLQVVEVASAGGAQTAYAKHVSNPNEWVGTLADKDTLAINAETLVVNHFDDSDGALENGMAGFVGESGLVLEPGDNILKFTDARYGKTQAQNPEYASGGSVDLTLSYRARYL